MMKYSLNKNKFCPRSAIWLHQTWNSLQVIVDSVPLLPLLRLQNHKHRHTQICQFPNAYQNTEIESRIASKFHTNKFIESPVRVSSTDFLPKLRDSNYSVRWGFPLWHIERPSLCTSKCKKNWAHCWIAGTVRLMTPKDQDTQDTHLKWYWKLVNN